MAMELSTITNSIFMIMNMKKILSLLALAIIASCSTLTPSSDNETLIKKFNSYDVTLSEVEKYAYAKYGNTKGDLIDIEALVRDSDTLGYVLNYGEGWEVLSGDKRCTPIMAKGDGHYLFDSLIPPQKIWFESELEKIGAIKDGYGVQTKSGPSEGELFWQRINAPTSLTKAEGDPIEDNQYWELVEIIDWDYDVYTTGHLIQTKWGQGSPWNQFCPYDIQTENQCVAGCWPVAGAQLLYFLHYNLNKPSQFYNSCVSIGYTDACSVDFGNSSLDSWDRMAKNTNDINRQTSNSAILIRWVGENMGVSYGLNETGGTINQFKSVLNNISITYSVDNFEDMDRDISYYLITKGQPCIIRAHTNEILGIPAGVGHAWIIDGYQIDTYTKKYVYQWTSRKDNHLYEYGEIREEFVETEYEYLLMNWGWNGFGDNGKYSPSVNGDWIINNPPDTYNFKYSKKIIYDFN